ncbi:MAG: HlyD family efflux transporter periplasmic adaptor subunit [Akkermansia sp.]
MASSRNPVPGYILLIALVGAVGAAVFFSGGNNVFSFINSMGESKDTPAPVLPSVRLAPALIPQTAVHLKGSGMVEAGRTSELSAGVTGVVEWVNPKFQTGEFFTAGEPLLKVSKQIYEADLAQAKADLEAAKLAQATEQADAIKAVRKWDNNTKAKGSQSELVLRLPHRRAANARVASATEQVERSQADVDHALLTIPYDSHIASKQVDLGMQINEGDPVGSIYSANDREVRIAVSPQKMAALPRDEKGNIYSAVEVTSTIPGMKMTWCGMIERVERQVDAQSQEMILVAKLDVNPTCLPEFRVPPVNLMVHVEIQAQTTDSLFWIPQQALVAPSEVWVMTRDGVLAKRSVLIEKSQEDQFLVILQQKQEGDRICLTVPKGAVVGMKVRDETRAEAVTVDKPASLAKHPQS